MNNIFINNLNALSKKNPKLAVTLQTDVPTDMPKLAQKGNLYNVFYKDKLIHSAENPLGEAQEIFSMAENTPVAIHLIYGLGLGYLFQVTALHSKGTVVLFEPDLNVLWFSFALVDFSKDILKDNVYIASDFETVSTIVYKKSNMKNSPQLLSLPSQRSYDPQGFEELVKKMQDMVGSFFLDLKYTREKFYPSLQMLLNNIPELISETPLARYKNVYNGRTAVIASAGPTLSRNIETLKKNRDKFVLITVGTALRTLCQHGLKPDFVCIIETYDSSKQLEGLDLSDINLITEPYSNPNFRKYGFKNVYSHISANTPTNHFWAELCEEKFEEYWSKGTVSYTALNCARLFGCTKIILVGQDLAYIEGQCYSKDSAYEDLHCQYNEETQRWEIMAKDFEKFATSISSSPDENVRKAVANHRLKSLNNSLYLVKGIQGGMLPTESVYAAFVKPLSEFAYNFKGIEYINTSLVGAQIDGFKNISLEEALENSSSVGDLTLEKIDFSCREKVVKNLVAKMDELKPVLRIMDDGKKLIKSLRNDLKRQKTVTTDILKTLRKLSVNYLWLASDFSNRSKMFDFITASEKIDLDYEMKMSSEFTIDNITKVVNSISKYYEHAETRIYELEEIISDVLGGIS